MLIVFGKYPVVLKRLKPEELGYTPDGQPLWEFRAIVVVAHVMFIPFCPLHRVEWYGYFFHDDQYVLLNKEAKERIVSGNHPLKVPFYCYGWPILFGLICLGMIAAAIMIRL